MTPKTRLLPSNQLWILRATPDLILFILTPLLILPIALVISKRIPPETLSIYVLGFGGFGHHLPGFIRAYCDPELFNRFKLRFTLIPAMLCIISGLYSFLNLNAVILATIAWGLWHGAMQVNGFLRIYDSKAGSFQPSTARLDWMMCLAWFGLAILHSPAKLFSLITPFYVSSGPLLPIQTFTILRPLWEFSTAIITVLFLINAFRQAKAGTPPSPLKLLSMVISFAYWWYCTVMVNSLLLGILMWEIFHDVQYNALVWLFQRRRVDKNLNPSVTEKFLFKAGYWRMMFYMVLILAYGYIGVLNSFADLNMPEKILQSGGALSWLFRATLVSALLHFYFDGFIWRIREESTRRGLTLLEKRALVPEVTRSSFLRHGWKWAFFVFPVAYLGISQFRGLGPDFKSQILNLAEIVPQSWLAHFLAGTYYKGEGNRDEAEKHFVLAVRYKPDLLEANIFLADLLYKKGDRHGAQDYYRRAVELDPDNFLAKMNLGFLYLQLEQPSLAQAQFEKCLAQEPENADLNFGMGSALLQTGHSMEAEEYLRKTVRLSPHHSQALNYLGLIYDAKGNRTDAIAYFRQALEADSSNVQAHMNLVTNLARADSAKSAR